MIVKISVLILFRLKIKGIGKLLFDRILKKVLEDNCSGVMFQVLDWNKPAINFYKKYDTQFDGEWLNCHLDAAAIREILGEHS